MGYLTPYTIPLFFSSAIGLALIWITAQRRHIPAARIFVLLVVAIIVWTIGYAFEIIAESLPSKLFWAKVQYVGITTTPVVFLIFIQSYLGFDERPHWQNVIALLLIPIVTIASAWTNESHSMLWDSWALSTAAPWLDLTYGPFFWVHTIYSYLLLLTGYYFAWQAFRSNSYVRQRQAAIILAATVPPWLSNLAYIFQLTPGGLDLTPLSFTVTSILFAYGLFRFQLLNVTPIARNRVIENLADAVIVIDALDRVVDINPAAAQLLDKTSREVLASPTSEVLASFPALSESLASHTNTDVLIRVKIGGEERVLNASTSLLLDSRETVQGRVITLHDITQQEQSADALRKSEAALRAMVQRLQELDQLKTRFLRNINHELRTPLTNIILYADLLRTGPSENHERYLEVLERQTVILRGLIEQTLDLERVEQMEHVVQLKLESTNLSQLVEQAIGPLIRQTSRASLNLEHEIPAAPVWIMGDRERLNQVLNDLVNNAINFTKPGGTISLILHPSDQAENHSVSLHVTKNHSVSLHVKDTGTGIAQNEQTLIFERFYRGENALASHIPGLGLGLSAAKEIVELHGGQITLESQLGMGSTFTVHLPLLQPST